MKGGKKVRRKIIFGTLVIIGLVFGAVTPLVTAGGDPPPPFTTGHEYYWVVHDDETPAVPPNDVNEWEWENNARYTNYIDWGTYDEIWYTAYLDQNHPYDGEIRPIINESGWHQNTWVHAGVEAVGTTLILRLYIYSPGNENPEYFNWTVTNADAQGYTEKFRITAYDWDTNQILVQFLVGANDIIQEKLDCWLTQFRMQLEFLRY